MCSDCGTGIFNLSLTQSLNRQLFKCSRPARWASWPLIVYLTHHRISIGDQISKHSFVWMSSAIWANYGSPICHLQDVSPILNVSASRSTNFGQIAGGSLLVASRESQTVSLPVFPIIHGRFGARKFLCRCCSRTYPLGRPFSSGIPNAFSHLFNALLLSWMALFLQQSWGPLGIQVRFGEREPIRGRVNEFWHFEPLNAFLSLHTWCQNRSHCWTRFNCFGIFVPNSASNWIRHSPGRTMTAKKLLVGLIQFW